MTRRFTRRFNTMYDTKYFPEPSPYNFGEALIKIPGLDGSGKMGKTEGNGIYLVDEPNVIKKKVMRAVTDAGPTEMNQKKPEPIQNIFTLMKAVSSQETLDFYEEQYNACKIRYGDMKKQLAQDIIDFTEPIRERFKSIYNNDDYLRKVAEKGAEKARESASKTLKEVRKIIGFKPF